MVNKTISLTAEMHAKLATESNASNLIDVLLRKHYNTTADPNVIKEQMKAAEATHEALAGDLLAITQAEQEAMEKERLRKEEIEAKRLAEYNSPERVAKRAELKAWAEAEAVKKAARFKELPA